MGRVLRWQGVCYFPTYERAANVARVLGLSRIVSYQLGWAIQIRVSGPYVGNDELRRAEKLMRLTRNSVDIGSTG